MKLIGLLLSVVFVSVLVWLVMPSKAAPPSAAPAAATGSLGAPPPADFGTNAGATKDYMRRQVCLAECVSEHRACKTIGLEPGAVAACDETRAACEARCP
ncbi:MAG: hypothetical protein IPG50_27795 [Myxococcales bacterium]|nr:hypothetical protein [Myxococcales bacterium]